MWKVIVLSAIGFTIVLIEALPKPQNLENINESVLHCTKVCNKFGGEAYFNEETSTCKCNLTESIDDAEIELIKKSAKFLNFTLEPIEPTINSTRNKRQIAPILPQNRPIMAPIRPGFVAPKRPMVIPGRQAVLVPPKFPVVAPVFPVNPHPILPPAIIKPNALPVLPITQPGALHALTNIRQRVNNLALNPAARNSQAEIAAIRASLQNLANQINIITPEQRARLVANRARMAQQRQVHLNNLRVATGGGRVLPLRPGLLGSAATNASSTAPPQKQDSHKITSSEETNESRESHEDGDIAPKPNKSIITQPKELIED